MIEWLTDNAIWLGAIAAIATVIALFTPLFKRDKLGRNSVSAKQGSVASGRDMKNVTITTHVPEPKRQPTDTDL